MRISPEARRRMSEAAKRSWSDPAVRERRLAAIARALSSPETRQRISEAAKRMWVARGKALPPMTAQQLQLYRKLRPLVGRDAALAEVFKSEGQAA